MRDAPGFRVVVTVLEGLSDGDHLEIAKRNGHYECSSYPTTPLSKTDGKISFESAFEVVGSLPDGNQVEFAKHDDGLHSVGKASKLDLLMQRVKDCRLCCEDTEILPKKRLINFIAERPNWPRYGGVPSIWTDWASRLDAKIVVIGKDWGPQSDVDKYRQQYEQLSSLTGDKSKAWRRTIRSYTNNDDRSGQKLTEYLSESAKCVGLHLPPSFMDDVFVTNAVLCARQGNKYSDKDYFDEEKSTSNCCCTQRFLQRQLEIVKPAVVVTLGKCRLWALGKMSKSKSLRRRIEEVHEAPPGYLRDDELGLSIVPVFHPAAYDDEESGRTNDKQIEDYSYIWRALGDSLHLSGKNLIRACFPNAVGSA